MAQPVAGHQKQRGRPAGRAIAEGSNQWTAKLGYASASIATVGGVIYFLVILVLILTGGFTFPPAQWVQIFGGVISLLFCPVLVVVMACLYAASPSEKKAFSLSSLAFTILFAVSVSINRFTQLGVVQQRTASGALDGIDWFLAYGGQSAMFGLEIMGWAWFLGLAMFLAAPIFSGGGLQRWLRGLTLLYGVLGMISAVGFLLASPLVSVGFAAWGLVLYIITGLLAVYFKGLSRG
jgi:hypothetical protein